MNELEVGQTVWIKGSMLSSIDTNPNESSPVEEIEVYVPTKITRILPGEDLVVVDNPNPHVPGMSTIVRKESVFTRLPKDAVEYKFDE